MMCFLHLNFSPQIVDIQHQVSGHVHNSNKSRNVLLYYKWRVGSLGCSSPKEWVALPMLPWALRGHHYHNPHETKGALLHLQLDHPYNYDRDFHSRRLLPSTNHWRESYAQYYGTADNDRVSEHCFEHASVHVGLHSVAWWLLSDFDDTKLLRHTRHGLCSAILLCWPSAYA